MSNHTEALSSSIPDDDAALVAAALTDDLAAFEALVNRHQKRMFNIAFRMIGEYEDAAEVVQDAFVAAYRNLKSFRAEARFTTWLTAITVNLSKNRLKQLKARQFREPVSLDAPVALGDGKVAMDPPSNEPLVIDRLEQQDLQKKVQDCVSVLEPDFREVLVLRDLQDFSYEEIGGILKLAAGTVKSRLSRARESVKECLKKAMAAF